MPRWGSACAGLFLCLLASGHAVARSTTAAPQPAAAELPSRPDLPPEKRALMVVGGAERWVDAAAAQAAGYTLLDLGDDWTPFIFQEVTDGNGNLMANRYRQVYLGLANDLGDRDGQPLAEGDHNYLELYGVPPTISVLRARMLDSQARQASCADVDSTKLKAATSIPPRAGKAQAKFEKKVEETAKKLEALRAAAQAQTLDELAQKNPKLAKDVALVQKHALNQVAFPEVEKRLTCEGLLTAPPNAKPSEIHQPGQFDEPMREAVIKFQHKHMLYDAAALRPETMNALGRTLMENDYAALVRVLTERIVSAGNILEDGSADTKKGPPTYINAAGETVAVRNLVDEAVKATLQQLDLESPEKALAFFQRHPAAELKSMRAVVKLPPVPDYYANQMDLSVVIDRGDVIYDPLFDENGKPTPQVRHHFPMLTLRAKIHDKWVPLIRWRTTIGGWRSDLASNGYEYFRYKGSDVGPRVWRYIVSGPVWIAPNSTPIRTLVKWKRVHGVSQEVVNYDEVGPGYLSAYGLVAAYNVVPGKNGKPDWDNGVRVHGSSEILSIRNPDAYSHGCHRLMNHLAVRMFSFVLRHRPVIVEGDKPLDFARQFLWKDDVFELRLPSKGYHYRLEPPLPVSVLEGNIIGKVKKPITTYVPKPGVQYPPGPPPSPKAGPSIEP
ncbi:MAG TPA: L,D-transpeptidase [Polyangia bacterium]